MGYYATVDGSIKPKSEEAAKEIVRVLDEREYFEYYFDANAQRIVIWQHEKYWEDEYYHLFEKTRGLVENGMIFASGEDGAQWCFEYDPSADRWNELNGRVVYEKGTINELVHILIDGFEDFLTEKGIWFPNPERDGDDPDVDPESVALIYGTDYGTLQTYIEDTLRNFGLI